jgi:hypothetical protein
MSNGDDGGGGAIIFLLAGVAAAGVGLYFYTQRDKLPTPQGTYLSGDVVDALTPSSPISGVIVEMNGLSTLTNSAGQFLLDNLTPGTYPVRLSKAGYAPVTA